MYKLNIYKNLLWFLKLLYEELNWKNKNELVRTVRIYQYNINRLIKNIIIIPQGQLQKIRLFTWCKIIRAKSFS